MAVPEIIRLVERPPNTVVQDTGHKGVKQYIVRSRKSIKYVPGGNPQPVNGKTIGYIFDGKFIPITDKVALAKPQMLSFGMSSLVKQVSTDILDDLIGIFDIKDAYTILSIAALKVIRPHISGSRMSTAYESCYISFYYPGIPLSKNSVSQMYKKLGMAGQNREAFFQKRLSRVLAEHHIAIDGTLKQDTGIFNDLSAFSQKARIKGCEDISVIYAYDIEQKEPICAQVFPGNSIDAVSYKSFIKDNKIQRGIIIADKGFPPNNIRDILNENPDLHYLTPIKRNDKRINEFKMTSFDGVLQEQEGNIQYKKVKTSGGTFLYAFRDASLAAAEEKTFLSKTKALKAYDQNLYQSKASRFGLIVFESDMDLEPIEIYKCYDSRWDLELVFKAYKNDDCLDRTSVQGDFSIYGNEFVNFISTLITCRIIDKATKAGLFSEMSYRDLVDDLNSAWRRTDIPEGVKPTTDDEYWVHTIPKVFELLEKLELCCPKEKPEIKKRGRKPGSKNKAKGNTPNDDTTGRSQGKHPCIKIEQEIHEKRPRGRPRTHPLPDPDMPKRPVGRPRIHPLPDPSIPKRPVGRPRKSKMDSDQ